MRRFLSRHWGRMAAAMLVVLAGAAFLLRPSLAEEGGADSFPDLALDGPPAAVEAYLDAGEDVNARDSQDQTALHVAAFKGDIPLLKLLLRHGADVDARDRKHWTPLHWAASNGHALATELLLRHGADPDAADKFQTTPLHLAVIEGRQATVRVLLKHHANLELRNRKGSTALHWAAYVKRRQIATTLLRHGANPDSPNNAGVTPLFCAIAAGSNPITKLLLDSGVDVNGKMNHDLPPAASAAKIYAESGANLDTARNGDAGLTPRQRRDFIKLFTARRGHMAAIVKTLLEHGADLTVKNAKGQPAAELLKAAGLPRSPRQ